MIPDLSRIAAPPRINLGAGRFLFWGLLAAGSLAMAVAPPHQAAAQTSSAQACPAPGTPYKIIPLTVSTVTTGGTAVTAIAATGARCGGYLVTSNAAGICVDQTTTAGTVTGTPSTTSCVAANTPFYLVPSVNAVSVNSPSSSVNFAGEGLN